MQNGYYFAAFSEVTIQCYNPPSGAQSDGKQAYVYTGNTGTNDTVKTTNANTVLKSLLGSGTNMSADYASASASASSSGAAATTEVATVPGLSGAGPGTNGQRGNDGSSGGSDSSSSDSNSATSSGSNAASTGGFNQGVGAKSNAPPRKEVVLQGSFFAIIVALVGMLVI